VIELPVIVNPAARGGRAQLPRESLERAASASGVRLVLWPTAAPGHATELAAAAVRDRFPVLAVWGGDGTYNEAARGLLGSETALLALPGGTTSVLGYELGLPRDPALALTAALAGRRHDMAVGRTDRGEIFLLMLSAGPDALILERVPASLKQAIGKAGIGVQAVVELLRGQLPRFEVEAGGRRHQASWCIVGNARCYGGPWHATPGADPFSPGFEVVSLERLGRRAVVPFFLSIPSGRHLGLRGVTRVQTEAVSLHGEGAPYQLDGDPAGMLPVSAHTASERLAVLLPT
jgi:diacylglycerol kinase (ATP)